MVVMTELIDCKVCTNDIFALSRIEENQLTAMAKFDSMCDFTRAVFYFKWSDDRVTATEYANLLLMAKGKSRLTRREIEVIGWEVDL